MAKAIIDRISAIEILDSRGNPTVLARVVLNDGRGAQASVPSGASTGRHEATELRDQEAARFGGRGVRRAVENVNTKIQSALHGLAIDDLTKTDQRMIEADGTPDKSNIGANAILAVSLATTRLAALVKGQPLFRFINEQFGFKNRPLRLPMGMMNITNAGRHSDAGMSIQEYMIVPRADSFKERVRIGSQIYSALGKILRAQGLSVMVGDEGGYAPKLGSNTKPLELIIEAADKAGFRMGADVSLAIDAAASEFYNPTTKQYKVEPEGKLYSSDSLINLYRQWIKQYGLILIEDGLAEDDWAGWQSLNQALGREVLIVGDDLVTTNQERLTMAIKHRAINGIIIKPNQIGTVSETIECIKLAQANNIKTVIANRSGETNDDFIADLAVGVGSEYIKAGSLCRGERVAKYNRLMEIEEWQPLSNQ